MMPPTTTGASTPCVAQQPHGLGHELAVRAREHREADEVDVLVARGGRDLLGREPDALVDDLHARVARRDRDLLGAVGVAVEPGLADEDADRVAELRARAPGPARAPRPSPSPTRRAHAADAGGRAVLAEHLAQRAGPLADGAAGTCQRDRRGHEVRRSPRAVSRSVVERARRPRRRRARRATPRGARSARCSAASSTTRMLRLAVERVDERRVAVSVKRLTPTTVMSPDSMRRTRSALLCTSRCFIASIMAKAPPPSSTHCELGLGRLGELGGLAPRPRASRRTGRRTRAGRSRTRAPAGSAATTAGPTGAAARAPRSTPGSCTARARASFESVTPSVSSTMRCTLFSGCASVSPSEFTCTP